MIYFQVSYQRWEIKKKRKLFKDYLFIFLNHWLWMLLPSLKAIVVQEFWPDSLSLPSTRCLTYHLGSTHPYSITVFMEPFSTSVFKFYIIKTNTCFVLSLEYLLLLPRSVLITISYKITLIFQHYDHIFLQLRTSIEMRLNLSSLQCSQQPVQVHNFSVIHFQD